MNSMPFRQLKSFLKILIGVQYERVKNALSAPSGHLSHRERRVALIRHGFAVPPMTLLCNCHWQLLDFDSLRGAPPRRGRLRDADYHTSDIGHWFVMTL